MRVLVVEFGGVDYEYLLRFQCSALMQRECGRVLVDGLWNSRDVSTQITSQLITGATWKESGVKGRRHYTNPRVEWLEKDFFGRLRGLPLVKGTSHLREGLYMCVPFLRFQKRNYLRQDLQCPTLFDQIPSSRAIYVPSYNPEPSFALRRNILDPRAFPEFGEEGALDLLEKNFFWRKRRLWQELGKEYQLLMCQFQYVDSLQHLYIAYRDQPHWAAIERGYARIDQLARRIVARAIHYDVILFLSDNGAAVKDSYSGFTHRQTAFYSLNREMGLEGVNMRDFHRHILEWVAREPHSSTVLPRGSAEDE